MCVNIHFRIGSYQEVIILFLLAQKLKKLNSENWAYVSIDFFFSEGGEWVFGSTDLALKSAQIVDFCSKSSADWLISKPQ